ncbi:hypothetical protein GGR50DRAFT_690116 [Xylaria sp. CBS 124048]|nr:hypothetical protein GGR50DRAFT_690116 [Xylaria sp. CBS 124048]
MTRNLIASLGLALSLGFAEAAQALGIQPNPNLARDVDLPETTAPPPTPVDTATLTQGEYIVTLVNSHTTAISTVHGQNENVPTAIQDGGSILEQGATAIFALPTNWAGRVAVAEAEIPIINRASLIEGAFGVQFGSEAQITLDVSYVDGFTVPITCGCGGNVRLGCNLDLLRTCPEEYRIDKGTCANPSRDTGELTGIFFKPCSPWAYTYPEDDLATVNGIPGCERNITCCVGTACAPHPKQGMCADAKGRAQPCSWIM